MSTVTLDTLLVVLMLINFFVLGVSRIRALVHAIAVQGLILGLMPLLVHEQFVARVVLIVLFTVLLKGVIIPRMLSRALRDVTTHREIQPLVSPTWSLVFGAIGTGLALAFARHVPVAGVHQAGLLVPTSLSTVLTGMLILTTRVKTITQVVGYLVLENGIFIFGLLLLEPLPLLVEMGVLLDLLVAVFVMVILINQIKQEFSSLNTEQLSALRE